MQIKDVENLAELAKIDLTAEEKEQILKDMGGILDYVKTIENVKVEVPMSQGVEKSNLPCNVWRDDKIEPREFSKDSIIKQFPDSQDNFLKVKKIL